MRFVLTLLLASVLPAQTTSTVLYAGTLQHGIWRSLDRGLHWSPAVTQEDALWGPTFALAVDSKAPYTLYAAGVGIFRSPDSGLTWTSLNPSDHTALILSLAQHPQDPRILLAGTLSEGILRSSDSGATWTTTLPEQIIITLVFAPNGTVYAGGPSGLYKSLDAGATFLKTSLPHSALAIALDPAQPTTLYAAGEGLSKSTTASDSWTLLPCSCPDGTLFSALTLNPEQPAVLVAGGMDAPLHALLLQSSNGGQSWSSLPAPESDSPQALAILPDTTLLLGTQGPGGFFRNQAATWSAPEDLPPGVEVLSLAQLRVTSPPPVVLSVTEAAAGSPRLQSNAWVSVFGLGLSTISRSWRGSDFINDLLPVQIEDVAVSVNGTAAPVAYISPEQVNILMPSGLTTGAGSLIVKNQTGSSVAFPIQVQRAAPAFFTLSPPRQSYAVVTFGDGSLATSVKAGDTVSLWSTGCGPTNPPQRDGLFSAALTEDPVAVLVGGVQATVLFAGMTAPGLCQFNIVIPEVAAGDQPLQASVGDIATTSTALLTIEP